MRKYLALFLLLPLPLMGQTCTTAICNAASASQSDVVAALPSAGNTNATVTVNIPTSTAAWTSATSYSIPASVTTLIIQGNTACTGSGDPAINTLACTDHSVIQDSLSGSSGAALTITVGTGKFLRMTGISLVAGSRTVADHGTLVVNCAGDTTGNGQFRFDHNHVSGVATAMTTDTCFGVIDHSIFDETGNNQNYLHIWDGGYNKGSSNGFGDGSWAANTDFGTFKFMFAEQNLFNNGTDDCTFGGRAVFRFNTMTNGSSVQTHPTGGGGPDERGCRAYEIYQNNMAAASPGSPSFNAFFLSAGSAMMWHNTTLNYSNVTTMHSMRRENCTYPETNTPNGWGYCGTSNNVNCGSPFTSPGSAWDQNTSTSTGYACIDQPGRGKGDLITGTMPGAVNSTTGTISWLHEATDPVYAWANTKSCSGCGGNFWANYNSDVLLANTDYYLDANESTGAPITFNGTVGVGSGLLSARPSTCTVGVRYFATDQGSWNSSGNGAGSGLAYKCTSTNTWTQDYTPFAYPHPLTATCSSPYSTSFSGTENPLSENGCWTVPSQHGAGSLWGDVQKNNFAFGVSEPTSFGDPVAILTGTWGADQTITGTVKINSTPSTCCHEVELHARMTIGSSSITGYEFLCPVASSPGYGYQIVRWSGPNGQYVYMNQSSSPHQCVNGDVLKAVVTGTNPTTLDFYNNGVLVLSGCDNGGGPGASCGGFTYSGTGGAGGPWTSGTPGIGVYDNADSSWSNFGLSAFTASDVTAATPTFSPLAGTYSTPQRVAISDSTAGSTIHYTVDGSTPTSSSAVYTHPIYVLHSQTLKAMATATGWTNSAVGTSAYTIAPAKTRFSLTTTSSSVNPVPFPQDNRACCGSNLAVLNPSSGTFNFTVLHNWITQSTANGSTFTYTIQGFPTWMTGLAATESAPPSDLNTSVSCAATGTTTTDCSMKSFVIALMKDRTGLSSQPLNPTTCSHLDYLEIINEFNTDSPSGSSTGWTGTYADLATMGNDISTITHAWCSNTVVVAGSASAIVGFHANGENAHYDVALETLLADWAAISNASLPDAISVHLYPSRQTVSPTPLPTTLVSNSDTACTSGNTPNVSCYVAVKDEVNQLNTSATLQNAAIVSWAKFLPIYSTEGGFGEVSQLGGTSTTTIGAAYVAQSMMAIAAQNPVNHMFYAANDATWGCYWNCGSGSSAWLFAFNQMSTWLNGHTITGTLTSTAVAGGNKWTLPLDSGAAELAFCDAWLTSCTASTSFNSATSLSGITTTPLSGSVTLTQEPVLLWNSSVRVSLFGIVLQ